jgi:hypothetical protein
MPERLISSVADACVLRCFSGEVASLTLAHARGTVGISGKLQREESKFTATDAQALDLINPNIFRSTAQVASRSLPVIYGNVHPSVACDALLAPAPSL